MKLWTGLDVDLSRRSRTDSCHVVQSISVEVRDLVAWTQRSDADEAHAFCTTRLAVLHDLVRWVQAVLRIYNTQTIPTVLTTPMFEDN